MTLSEHFLRCTTCDSSRLELLGTLGTREWYRCRTCGAETSHDLEDQESDLEEPEAGEGPTFCKFCGDEMDPLTFGGGDRCESCDADERGPTDEELAEIEREMGAEDA